MQCPIRAIAGAVFLLSASALAEEEAPVPAGDEAPAEEPAEEGGLSAEERRVLEEALKADLEAAQGGKAASAGDGFDALSGAATRVVKSLNLDLALILDVAGAYFSDEPLQLGGHDPSETGFVLQQLELSAGASVDPFFRFDANLVFSLFGVEIEEAFVTTTQLPFNLKARAGQFLTRFGRLNPTHPHAWHFVDQPLVLGKMLGPEGSRGLGVELSWLAPLPWYLELIASATGAAGACCARSFFGEKDLGVRSPQDLLYAFVLKQFFPFGDEWSLLFGLSLQEGPNPTGPGNRTEIFGTDLYLRYRPVGDPGRSSLSLQAEGLYRRRQVPGDVLMDAGGYAQVVYQFLRRWEVGARAEAVTGSEDDPIDPLWTGTAFRFAAQGTFYPSHFSRLRLQAGVGLPPDGEDPVYSVVLALEVLAGAHGAHEF